MTLSQWYRKYISEKKERNLAFKKAMIKLFDNPIGRWYLGVPIGKKIYKITNSSVHYYTGEVSKRNGRHIIAMGKRIGSENVIFGKILRLARAVSIFAFLPLFPKSLFPLVALTDFNKRIDTDANDVREQESYGCCNQYSLSLGNEAGITFGCGLRFVNVTIPQGADIETAIITFQSKGNYAADTVRLKIMGIDVDNCAAFDVSGCASSGECIGCKPVYKDDYQGVPKTDAKIDWDFTTDWVTDGNYDTVDFASVVQEIVDRGSWESGNAMGIVVRNDASSTNALRIAKDYGDSSAAAPYLQITYTEIVAPTVTTQAGSSVEETTATGNGNITVTGGENCHTRGICYMEGTSGDPTTANSKVFDNGGGSYGTGAFAKAISGLSQGTGYRLRAYAINSAGTGYGVTVQITTKPEVPTSFTATTQSKSQINLGWTKGTGATKTYIRRKIGSAPTNRADGDLVYNDTGESYNDTGLGAGTHYYYRAWSWVTGDIWSDAYADADDTTDPAFATFASLATLEKETLSTFASLANLEREAQSTFAGLAFLEKTSISTFASLAVLEILTWGPWSITRQLEVYELVKITVAVLANLEAPAYAIETFACQTTLEIPGDTETFAALSTLEKETFGTFATYSSLDKPMIAYSWQRKNWCDETPRYWQARFNPTESRIEFWYSTDFESWNENVNARISDAGISPDFSLRRTTANDNVVIVYTNGTSIYVREISGTYPGIVWGWSVASAIVTGGANDKYIYPYVSLKKSAKWQVIYTHHDTNVADYYYIEVKESLSSAIINWGSSTLLSSNTNTDPNCYGVIERLSIAQDYAIAVWVRGSTLELKEKSPNWDASPTLVSTIKKGTRTAFAIDNDTEIGQCHIIYIKTNGNVGDKIYEYGSGLGSEEILDANANNEYPCIAEHLAGNVMHVWKRGVNIWMVIYPVGGSHGSPLNVVSNINSEATWLTINENESNSCLFIAYQEGTVIKTEQINFLEISTFASIATLERIGFSTLAVYAPLEGLGREVFAGISTLEREAMSVFAGQASLERISLGTFATLANLERVGFNTVAGITLLEREALSTFAVYSELEALRRSTFAVYSSLEALRRLTFAVQSTLEREAVSTLASWPELQYELVKVFASITTLEREAVSTVAGLASLERVVLNTFASLVTLEAPAFSRRTFAALITLEDHKTLGSFIRGYPSRITEKGHPLGLRL